MRKPNTLCLFCGTKFYARPSDLKRGWSKFCTRKCYAQHKGFAIPNKYPIQRKCLECKQEFTIPSYQFGRKKYCNSSCSAKSSNRKRKGMRYKEDGKEPSFRKRLLEQFGNKCMEPGCGYELFVDAHHIDPKRKTFNNRSENGILLCPNHHREADRGLIGQEQLRNFAKNYTKPMVD